MIEENLCEYLRQRPIGPILSNSSEKDNLRALKLMTVIDYYTDQRSLYAKIKIEPKLLQQLMQFYSYANFEYFDCQVNRAVGDRLLQCKFCEFIAPYALVLTHMALIHNNHISTKTCAYCNRCDLVAHSRNDSLQKCYEKYLTTYGIKPDTIDTTVKVDFYKVLKDVARSLGVIITRNDSFAGTGYARVEPIAKKIPNFPTRCTVFTQKVTHKDVNDRKLDYFFNMIIELMLGGNGTSRLKQNKKANTTDDEVIILSDDDDDDDDNQQSRNKRPTNAVQNVVVKVEQSNVEKESSASAVPTVTTPPVAVVQIPVERRFRSEQSPQAARLENGQQAPPAGTAQADRTQSTGSQNNATGAERIASKDPNTNRQNIEQASNAARIEVHETRVKSDPCADDFGNYVANRLTRIENPIKRRKLELLIQQKIVEIEVEDIAEIE